MGIINTIVQFVMDLGGGVFLPFTIIIMGLLFKMNIFESMQYGRTPAGQRRIPGDQRGPEHAHRRPAAGH